MAPPGTAAAGMGKWLDVLAIPATSSVDFLEIAFDCYRRGQVFAISRSDADLAGRVARLREAPAPAAPRHGWARLAHEPRFDDAPAQIVFTSGTEGRPKAIVLSHRNLADVVTRLNGAMAVTPEIREYVGVPVTYSFGLGRARAVAAAGGAVYVPERFDPAEIRALLEEGEINAVSAVPSLWSLVLASPAAIGAAGARMRWIEIGSQHMPAADKMAMKRLFPNARIVQHYGLTEASRTTFLIVSEETEEAALESVGRATGTAEVRLDAEGAIAIRGDHVALGRLEDDGTLVPLTDAEGWLHTRDRGEMAEGRLVYRGRLDDQINVAGIKLAAEALEREIAALAPGAEGHFAVTGIRDPQRGEAVLLAVEDVAGERAGLLAEAARLALARRGIPARGALRTLQLGSLPRTGTNKLRRAALRDLAPEAASAAGPEAPGAAPAILGPDERRVARTWQQVVGPVTLAPGESFYDAGGDSLSSVQVGLVMEGEGYGRAAVRATLEGRCLAEVAREAGPAGRERGAAAPAGAGAPRPVAPLAPQSARNWAVGMTRGIMVLSVLLSHWGPGLFERLGVSAAAESALSIFYRMGTPGFAAVFGMGVGAFLLPGFETRRAAVLTRMRMSLLLVLAGIALTAATLFGLALIEGRPLGPRQVSYFLYGVLGYYALALATGRWWMPALARLRRPVLVLPALALGSWGIWQGALLVVTREPQESLLELPRLMLVAGYGVFKLAAATLGGMAAGVWLARQETPREAGGQLFVAGATGALLGTLTLLQLEGADVFARRDNPAFVSLPGLVLYVSLAMTMTGGFLWLLARWSALPRAGRAPLQVLIAIGGLALPAYVFHGLVIPAKDILVALGLPGALALAATMGTFLAGAAYGTWRLHRMYFG